MATCNITELITGACSNHFNSLDEKTAAGVLLQLLCDIKQNGDAGRCVYFDSGMIDPPASGQVFLGPHGLGGTPTSLRAVVVVSEAGGVQDFPVGYEIDVFSFFDYEHNLMTFSLSADNTNILLCTDTGDGGFNTAGGGASVATRRFGPPCGQAIFNIDVTKCKARIYASRCT